MSVIDNCLKTVEGGLMCEKVMTGKPNKDIIDLIMK